MIRSITLLLLLVSLGTVSPPTAAQGRIVTETLHSDALQGNRIGDTPDRAITIYLPPSYDQSPTRRYPVVYLLHGATSDPKEWLDGSYQGMDLRASLDNQAGQGEFIVVMPMASNRFGGSFYVSSAAFGRWEDFIAKDLVRFVDAHFRTLPTRRSRGLAGHSMGGFGVLYLVGRHPEVFGSVYALSPCCLGLVGDIGRDGERWQRPLGGPLRAMAMAFDPKARGATDDATPPQPFVTGPDGKQHDVPDVIRTWQQFLPLDRLARDPSPYRRLCGVEIDAGRQDQIPNVPLGAAAFSEALKRAGIPHIFTAFDGDHIDHVRERFETAMIPFFARVLTTQGRPGTCQSR